MVECGAQVTYVGLGWPTWPPTWVGQIGWLAHFGGHSCPRPTPCLSCHRLFSLLTCFSSQNHPLPIRNADNGFQMPPFDRITFFLLTSSRFPFKETFFSQKQAKRLIHSLFHRDDERLNWASFCFILTHQINHCLTESAFRVAF